MREQILSDLPWLLAIDLTEDAGYRRRAVLELLGRLVEAAPRMIAQRIGVPTDLVRRDLGAMARQGIVVRTGPRFFRLAAKVPRA